MLYIPEWCDITLLPNMSFNTFQVLIAAWHHAEVWCNILYNKWQCAIHVNDVIRVIIRHAAFTFRSCYSLLALAADSAKAAAFGLQRYICLCIRCNALHASHSAHPTGWGALGVLQVQHCRGPAAAPLQWWRDWKLATLNTTDSQSHQRMRSDALIWGWLPCCSPTAVVAWLEAGNFEHHRFTVAPADAQWCLGLRQTMVSWLHWTSCDKIFVRNCLHTLHIGDFLISIKSLISLWVSKMTF